MCLHVDYFRKDNSNDRKLLHISYFQIVLKNCKLRVGYKNRNLEV